MPFQILPPFRRTIPMRHHSHASTPTPLHTTATPLAHPCHRFHATTPPLSRNRAAAPTQLRLRRCAQATPHSRTYDTTRTQPRHHTRAPTTPLAHNHPATLTHLRLRRCAPTTPLPRIRAITLAHLRLRRCAPTTPLAHDRPATLTHLRLRRCAQVHPLPSRVALAPLVFRTLFYVALRSLVCTFSTNSFKYSYKSF